MPTNGVDPNTLEIVAPCLNRIINVKGDVNAGTHVEHVHFDGLEFRYTDFTLGQIEARVHTDTAIMFENTTDCSVRKLPVSRTSAATRCGCISTASAIFSTATPCATPAAAACC